MMLVMIKWQWHVAIISLERNEVTVESFEEYNFEEEEEEEQDVIGVLESFEPWRTGTEQRWWNITRKRKSPKFDQKNDILVIKWHDNRSVALVTTYSSTEPLKTEKTELLR